MRSVGLGNVAFSHTRRSDDNTLGSPDSDSVAAEGRMVWRSGSGVSLRCDCRWGWVSFDGDEWYG